MLVGRAIATSLLVLGLMSSDDGAFAMERAGMTLSNCRISGADKLPHGIAGKTICDAIDAAAREHAPRTPFGVEVRILSASKLAAVVTLADGRKLPEQKIGVSDSALRLSSIARFAQAIARQVADAG